MRKKLDANHNEIAEALRACGASVQSLADVGGGVTDLLVGFRGMNFLLEVKQPGEELRPNQRRWHNLWRGQVATVHTIDEALAIVLGTLVQSANEAQR